MSIFEKLELNFWQIMIRLIQESKFVRYIFPRLYVLRANQLLVGFLLPATIIAIIGLSIGFFIGVYIPLQ